MAVGTDHHPPGEGVVLKNDLVNDTGSRLPEADPVLIADGGEEIVDLTVLVVGAGQVLIGTLFGQDKVVTVYGRGDGHLIATGHHELQQGHLGGSVLHGYAVGLEEDVVFAPAVPL